MATGGRIFLSKWLPWVACFILRTHCNSTFFQMGTWTCEGFGRERFLGCFGVKIHGNLKFKVMAKKFGQFGRFFFDRSMLWFYCYLNEEEIGILDEVFLDTLGKFGQWIFNFRDSSHLAFYLEVSIKMYSAWDIPWFDISLTPGIGSNKIMFFPSVFGGLLNIHKSLC
jgi:hypothetical protein